MEAAAIDAVVESSLAYLIRQLGVAHWETSLTCKWLHNLLDENVHCWWLSVGAALATNNLAEKIDFKREDGEISHEAAAIVLRAPSEASDG